MGEHGGETSSRSLGIDDRISSERRYFEDSLFPGGVRLRGLGGDNVSSKCSGCFTRYS